MGKRDATLFVLGATMAAAAMAYLGAYPHAGWQASMTALASATTAATVWLAAPGRAARAPKLLAFCLAGLAVQTTLAALDALPAASGLRVRLDASQWMWLVAPVTGAAMIAYAWGLASGLPRSALFVLGAVRVAWFPTYLVLSDAVDLPAWGETGIQAVPVAVAGTLVAFHAWNARRPAVATTAEPGVVVMR